MQKNSLSRHDSGHPRGTVPLLVRFWIRPLTMIHHTPMPFPDVHPVTLREKTNALSSPFPLAPVHAHDNWRKNIEMV